MSFKKYSMFRRGFGLLLVVTTLFLSVQIVSAQQPVAAADDKKMEELKSAAAGFLSETAVEVGNLRTLENRISFSSEIAGLMWFHDEQEARRMFQTVIVDFRQLLQQTDAQFTAIERTNNTDAAATGDSDGLDDPDLARKLTRKFGKAISVRNQIAVSLAEHDAKMAYDFFTGTAQAVVNPRLKEQIESSDSYFELKLLNAIAESDVDRALEGARKRLAKGASFEIIGLLQKIYAKDADKGAAFGEEIISKIKSGGAGGKAVDTYLLYSLLSSGASSLDKTKEKTGKKPMFSETSLRELADLLAQEILRQVDGDEAASILPMAQTYLPLIERFSPGRAALLKQKFKVKDSSEKTNNGSKDVSVSGNGQGIGIGEDVDTFSSEKKREEDLSKNMESLAGQQISKEEKEKLIAQARQSIGKMRSREQRIMALSMLAAQIAKLGDKELAASILTEARGLVNAQPKNYKDFLAVWLLASGYSEADPDKAFPLLEDTIYRLNDTISAFIKVGEFIDVEEEIIEGEEVQVGSFGGEITRGLMGELGVANSVIKNLALADFARTKALTGKFDRLEVRILARMLVLRAILGDKKVVAEN